MSAFERVVPDHQAPVRVPRLSEEPEIVKFVRIDAAQWEADWAPAKYDPVVAKELFDSHLQEAIEAEGGADGKPAATPAVAKPDRVRGEGQAAAPPLRKPDRDRKRGPSPRQREALEADIEKKEAERAALAGAMNDPDFYLVRKDANELIARYELLGGEVERLYAEQPGEDVIVLQ